MDPRKRTDAETTTETLFLNRLNEHKRMLNALTFRILLSTDADPEFLKKFIEALFSFLKDVNETANNYFEKSKQNNSPPSITFTGGLAVLFANLFQNIANSGSIPMSRNPCKIPDAKKSYEFHLNLQYRFNYAVYLQQTINAALEKFHLTDVSDTLTQCMSILIGLQHRTYNAIKEYYPEVAHRYTWLSVSVTHFEPASDGSKHKSKRTALQHNSAFATSPDKEQNKEAATEKEPAKRIKR